MSSKAKCNACGAMDAGHTYHDFCDGCGVELAGPNTRNQLTTTQWSIPPAGRQTMRSYCSLCFRKIAEAAKIDLFANEIA